MAELYYKYNDQAVEVFSCDECFDEVDLVELFRPTMHGNDSQVCGRCMHEKLNMGKPKQMRIF